MGRIGDMKAIFFCFDEDDHVEQVKKEIENNF